MPLYLGREASAGVGRALRRVTVEWETGKLDLEPQDDGRVRLQVTVGSEREEHHVDLGDGGDRTIQADSKLIQIEEIGKAGAVVEAEAAKRPPVVNQQSKLIKIEDVGASLPEVTIILPGS